MKPQNIDDFLQDKWLAERGVGYRMAVTEEQKENKMGQMTDFEKEYQQRVLQWAHDRNIIEGSDVMRQLLKTCTEAGEMVDAARKIDIDEYVDSIGDQWVTLVIGMKQSGVTYQKALDSAMCFNTSNDSLKDGAVILYAISCIADGILKDDKVLLAQGYGTYLQVLRNLEKSFTFGVAAAWNTIKDRKGKMVNGVFVKEQDLYNEAS